MATSELLRRVRRAALRRRRALEEYRASVRAAHDAGEREVDIGAAAGISQASVSRLLSRIRREAKG